MTVSDLLEQPCNKSDAIKLVTNCRQVVFALLVPSCCYKLLTACSKLVHNLGQAVRRQLVDNLFADYARKISQLVNKMCSQQACSKLVNKL
jgi:hypothetical protein